MADDDGQVRRAEQQDRGVDFPSGSWLQNCRLHELPDGTITWTIFDRPSIPERDGDLQVTLSEPGRPDQLAREYYGDGTLWWVIAVANDIRLPSVGLHPGRKIRIPDPDYIREQVRAEGGIGR